MLPGGIIHPGRPHPDRHALPVAAGVLFVDEHERVLLVEPTYKPFWDLPGGMVEPGESPRTAAQREVKEELGFTITPGRLLVCDYLPPRPGRSEGLRFVFDGGSQAMGFAIFPDPRELRSWAWCTPAEVIARTHEHAPMLCDRIIAARLARNARGIAAYREAGRRPR